MADPHPTQEKDVESPTSAKAGSGIGIDDNDIKAFSLDNFHTTYQSLVNALPLALLIKDTRGQRVFANETYLRFRGKTWAEIQGKRDSELFPDDLSSRYSEEDARVIETGDSHQATEETIDSHGNRVWIDRRKSPVINQDGNVIGVQVVFWDVTQRVHGERQQSQDRYLLNALLQNIPDSIYFKDTDSRFIRVSDAMSAKFGMESEADVIGKTDADIFTEEHARGAREDELRVIETGKPLVDRLEKETWPDRDDTWCMSTKMPFVDESGQIVGTFGISRDVTELKRSQDALREARDAADKANRAKSDFLANMSHEIRTPMNAIIGMSELLSQTELTTEQRDYVALVRESSDALLRLLNDILDFSKIEARKLELESIPFSLREVVGRTGRTLSIRAAEKGLELACRVAPEVPDRLLGDPGRLRQVLMNLIGNAVKFTDRGEVSVNVRLAPGQTVPESDSGDGGEPLRLQFSVRDTGVGIPDDKQAAVLAAFTQADTSTTRRYGGTGLGLAISKQLVELMQGELTLRSRVGKGTTFSFEASFFVSDEEAPDVGERLGDLTDLPVLVVDDNATNRRILDEIFTAWRLRPTLAHDASMALHAIDNARSAGNPFPLVVLDCMMPEVDGFDLAERIRERSDEDETTMIMLSSATRPDDTKRCGQLKIARFMTKPVIQSELLDTVLSVMNVSNQAVVQTPAVVDHSCPPMRVLVAEDGLANQHVAVGMLQAAGHQALVAVDGREAVQRWESESFDVILMDMHMPVMDGLEATEAIREREKASGGHIPIIALTAAAMSDDAKACRKAGMDDFLAKPISPAQLYEMLLKHAPADAQRSSGEGHDGETTTVQGVGTERTTHRSLDQSASNDSIARHLPETFADPDVVDFEAAAARLPGGIEGARRLAEVFQDECDSIMTTLRRCIPKKDAKEVRRAAHTLKGSASLFSAHRVVDAARAIEQRAVSDEIDATEQLLPLLETEVANLKDCLARFLSENTGN